MSRKNT